MIIMLKPKVGKFDLFVGLDKDWKEVVKVTNGTYMVKGGSKEFVKHYYIKVVPLDATEDKELLYTISTSTSSSISILPLGKL